MDHHSVSPPPPSDPTAPALTFLHSPLAIAALMFIASVGGGYLRDRLAMETRDTTSATQIEALGARVDTLERSSLPEAQFRDFQGATTARLDEIRQDLRDLKRLLAKP